MNVAHQPQIHRLELARDAVHLFILLRRCLNHFEHSCSAMLLIRWMTCELSEQVNEPLILEKNLVMMLSRCLQLTAYTFPARNDFFHRCLSLFGWIHEYRHGADGGICRRTAPSQIRGLLYSGKQWYVKMILYRPIIISWLT